MITDGARWGSVFVQEAVQAKLAAASVEEDEDVAAAASTNDNEQVDSDEDSVGFGLKKQPDVQAAKGKRTKPKILAKGSGLTNSPAAKPAPSSSPGKLAGNNTEKEKVEKTVEVAEACDAGLKAIVPTQYWNGSFKPKDLSAKLTKADAACTSLEKFPTESKACAVLAQLKDTIQECNDWSDILDLLRNCKSEPMQVLEMNSAQVSKFFKLPADCVSGVCIDIGRKLIEAACSPDPFL